MRGIALLLTVLTGFSGLVYEVAWQRYLGTLLGSHSEATASLLGLFLAGLSLGYLVFGVVTRRLVESAIAKDRQPRLLLLYGCVEGAIGLYALAFPWLFSAVQALSLRIPHGPGGAGFALDVTLCAVLVLPPTVLMGGTVPILTQALSRSLADATRFHAFVYAFNTAGAFAGALMAGFVLIPVLGLQGVMLTVSAINLGAGACFIALGLRGRAVVLLDSDAPEAAPGGIASYAAVALLVGLSMMALQTVFIRLGGLSFGASEYTFAMVVAVFVACIALGSFAVSAFSKIPDWMLVANHWLLVIVLYVLHGQVDRAPYWAHVLRSLFRDIPEAFALYYAAAFVGIALAIGPAVLLSGASLPLLFHRLRRETGSLGAVAGKIYAWNTLGSFFGALIGGYALLFWLDLDHVYRLALAALTLAAFILTVRVARLGPAVGTAVVLLPVLGATALLPAWNTDLLTLGLFRNREAWPATFAGPDALVHQLTQSLELRFYDDDPTASVAVQELPGTKGVSRSIVTNGKSDGNTEFDYPTMGLAAIIPALFSREAARSFVIGYGTGITAGELASLPTMERVLVAEISPGVVKAAPLFDAANLNASRNPKVEIVRSDAYRTLLRGDERFDVIVSEPSNPWVTGVEMLFSREFLTAARSRLRPGGVYAQWYHQYETDAASVELVLRTYASVFDHLAVWYGRGPDLLLLGFDDPVHALDLERLERRAALGPFARALERSSVASFPALLAHELVPLGAIHAAGLRGALHTLHHPRLSHQAGRAFFVGGTGNLPYPDSGEARRVGAQNSLLARYLRGAAGDRARTGLAEAATEACKNRSHQCATLLAKWKTLDPGSSALMEQLELAREPGARFGGAIRDDTITLLTSLFEPEGGAVRPVSVREARLATELFRSHYQYATPFDPAAALAVWEGCTDDPLCESGIRRARALLLGPRAAAATP